MGTQEAIYCGVPRIGIPIFADQELNIENSERMGLAIKVAYDRITKDTVLSAARKLLEDRRQVPHFCVCSRVQFHLVSKF